MSDNQQETPKSDSQYTVGAISQMDLSPVTEEEIDGDKFWVVNEKVKLHFFTAGNGPTPLLWIHGGPGLAPKNLPPAFNEENLPNSLAEKYTIYVYQQRGVGKSPKVVENLHELEFPMPRMGALFEAYSMTELVADIERIRKHLVGPEGKLNMIGHSFGGGLATLYAAEFPTKVDKLLLHANGPILSSPHPTNLIGWVRGTLSTIEGEEGEKKVTAFDEFMGRFMGSMTIDKPESHQDGLWAEFMAEYYGTAFAQHLALEAKKVKGTPAVTAETVFAAFAAHPHDIGSWAFAGAFASKGTVHDFREAIKERANGPLAAAGGKVHTLLGRYDWIKFSDAVPQGAEVLGFGATLAEDGTVTGPAEYIEGAAHFAHSEAPKEFAAAVEKFFLTA